MSPARDRSELGTFEVSVAGSGSELGSKIARALREAGLQSVRVRQLATAQLVRVAGNGLRRVGEEPNVARPSSVASEDRAALLREIDHRVKNNLQVMQSLLRLRSEFVRDPAARAPLLDCQRRIAALALAHDHLHRSFARGRINARAYLEDLVRELLIGSRAVPVAFTIDEELSLHLDEAMQLGLVTNELILNVIEHAWQGRAPGCVTLSLRCVAQNLALAVVDDGVGVAQDQVETTSGFGLRFVRELLRPFGGHMVMSGTTGTHVEVVLPRRAL